MQAVILAGGKGTRLYPYTVTFPKPLVPIDDIPILEIVVRQLKSAGFTKLTMAVGHLAELIIAYFGNGDKFGLEITYSREDEPLGTAGPLRLIDGLQDAPFLVMNGDLLTSIDYSALWDYHTRQSNLVTIASHTRQVQIDLGVLACNDDEILTDYIEKPSYDYRVSMGIYIFSPAALNYIPLGQYFDFPTLIHELLRDGKRVGVYPFTGYWLDIGRPDDYARAIDQFRECRNQFLPGE